MLLTEALNFQIPGSLALDCGKCLRGVNIRYETAGRLTPEADNAILVCHALTGDAHVCGKYTPDDAKSGWWDSMIGPGKYIDTDRYFVICSNILGGCSGSTGPRSVNPDTGNPYNMSFPVITIRDMVRAQMELIKYLGIKRLLAVAGGSMGGMQVLEWAVNYPDMMKCVLPIATAACNTAQNIAFDWVGRNAIQNDPHWNNGDYSADRTPETGLATARMLAHITYLSDETLTRKFGRGLQKSEDYSFKFDYDFAVESYLEHQGHTFVGRFDANSYCYITRAIDYYDLAGDTDGNLDIALAGMKADAMLVSFSSDWLFPPKQLVRLVNSMLRNRIRVTYSELQSSYGHDAFLLETDRLGRMVRDFLANQYAEVRRG